MAKHSLWMATLIWAGIATAVQAQQRSIEELDAIANSVFAQTGGARAIATPLKMNLKSSEVLQTESLVGNEAFYIYTPTNGTEEKFVIVSGDQRMPAVLGYSDESSFDSDNMPEGLKWFLKKCESDALLLVQNPTWTRAAEEEKEYPVVEPLLGKRAWGQDAPFNQQCPAMGGGHAKTGCVATALAQIMAYHRYPATYDWDNMPDSYEGNYTKEQADVVAKLMHDIGESCCMEYGRDESTTHDIDAEKALCTTFGYDDAVRIIQQSCYDEKNWAKAITNELLAQRPILYSGIDLSNRGGHAFVVDGLNSDGLYHINWGWSNSGNGYYSLNNLAPDKDKNYSSYCTAIINIHPDNGIPETEPTNIVAASINSSKEGTMATYFNSNISILSPSNLRHIPFEGEIQLLLTDENDSIIKLIDSPKRVSKEQLNSYYSFTVKPYSWKDIPNGQYRLRVGVRQEGYEKWGFVKGPTSIDGIYGYYDFALNLKDEQYIIGPASIKRQFTTTPSHWTTLHLTEGTLQFTPNTDLAGWEIINTCGAITTRGGSALQGENVSIETTPLPAGIYLLRGVGKDGQVYVTKFARR